MAKHPYIFSSSNDAHVTVKSPVLHQEKYGHNLTLAFSATDNVAEGTNPRKNYQLKI